MKIDIRDTQLFFDVEGLALVPSEAGWRERPTVVMLHPGPGADHSLYKHFVGPSLAQVAQVVYLDHRGEGRSGPSRPLSPCTCPATTSSRASGAPAPATTGTSVRSTSSSTRNFSSVRSRP